LPKRGIIPPFGKGRVGGILQNNAVIILRLLIKYSQAGWEFSSFGKRWAGRYYE